MYYTILHTRISTSFLIGGNAIEFVGSWPHLGHVLTTDMNEW